MSRLPRWLIGGVLSLVVPGAGAADTARDLIRQGNEHYAAGRYADALKCYEQAATVPGAARDSAELLHDRAAANFKLGEIDAARDLWVRLKGVNDAAFEARTRYNLGNCDYADALAAAQQQNARKALQFLGQAAEQYREALRLDPALEDARANLELTQLLRRQIEEQQKQQEHKQDSSGQPQQDQQKQDQQTPSTQPSQAQQGSQSQPTNPNESPISQPSETQPSEPPEPQQPQEGEEQNQDQRNQSGQQPEQQEEPAPESQPAAEPKPAESQPASSDERQAPAVPVEMTRQQAERLLQMIRDAEKLRRERLARERVARQKPVERDW